MTAPEVTEFLSVAMTSSPEVARSNFFFMDSGVFEYTEFNSELHYPIVYGPSLRSASVLTLGRIHGCSRPRPDTSRLVEAWL